MEYIKENIEKIKANIERIKKERGITRGILLLAVTKNVDAEKINYAIDNCGITAIGENRVQELLEKYDSIHKENISVHFIGTLQTNKVKYIIDKVDMIQSLDSIKLAREIDRQAKKAGKIMDALVEVNIGLEENKGGVYPADLCRFIEDVSVLDNIQVRGLMTMAPKTADKREYNEYFAQTYKLFIDISQKSLHNINMDFLSMGMSDSYESAVEEGANIVRIGSSIFVGKNS